jgi:pimeloyl-ACP methyl ester carboxylesterase
MALLWVVLGSSTGCASQPRQHVKVDGQTVAYTLAGERAPTVIFESGLGHDLDVWSKVIRGLADDPVSVFAYDRPGYGESLNPGDRLRAALEFAPGSELLSLLEPRNELDFISGERAARRLSTILSSVSAEPPYILVGHSLGGQYLQIFAALFPEQVAGIVLVDSRPKHFTRRCLEKQLSGCEVPSWLTAISEAHVRAEIAGLATTAAQIPEPAELGRTPVIRLVAGRHVRSFTPAHYALWVELQNAEAQAQARGRMELVDSSGHDIQIERPDTVIAAIREILRLAREDVEQSHTSTQNSAEQSTD